MNDTISIPNNRKYGITLFFTGLPCSGKTTIAKILCTKLEDEYQRSVTYLDGDIVRENLSKGLSFSKEDRDINIKRIGYVASEITKHGGITVCAAIAPYARVRKAVRCMVEDYGTFIEAYVDTPLNVCESRDVKGMYKKARQGTINNFTGVDDPYEIPIDSEIILDTRKNTPEQCVEIILKYLINTKFML